MAKFAICGHDVAYGFGRIPIVYLVSTILKDNKKKFLYTLILLVSFVFVYLTVYYHIFNFWGSSM